MWVCQECGTEFKHKMGPHIRKHKGNFVAWNKGQTKETNQSVLEGARKNSIIRIGRPTGRIGVSWGNHTVETKDKISKAFIEKWKDPEYREGMLKVLQEASKDENRIAKVRKTCKITGENNRGKPAWNKGLTKEDHPGIAKMGEANKIMTPARWAGIEKAREKLKKYRGELASNWQGGKSLEEYGDYWTDEFKNKIRKRNNFTCADCGKLQDELVGFEKVMDVHHLDSDKRNGTENNLITLCRSCHMIRHYKK